MRSDFVDAYINLGDVLIKQGKLKQAIQIYKKGIQSSENVNSKTADLYFNLGVAYSIMIKNHTIKNDSIKNDSIKNDSIKNEDNQDNFKLIAEYFVNATTINPFHKESLVNLAILIQRNNDSLKHLKESLIEKMKNYSGSDQQIVLFNLALLLADQDDNKQAVYYLKQAIQIENNFSSAIFNLAVILIEEKRFVEAEQYLHELLAHHSNHTKGLMLLGNLYFSQLNYIRAEEVSHLIDCNF